MSFVNELFPRGIAKGSRGGPQISISVIEGDGGVQERAKRWQTYRWEYDAGIGIQTLDDLDEVYNHYLAVSPENSFPFSDPQDFTSALNNRDDPSTAGTLDQEIGVGDGIKTVFQLIKTYTFGTRTYVRNIRKPVSGTVNLAFGSTLQTEGPDYTIDYATGEVTFPGGNVPPDSTIINASFKFYVALFYGKDFRYMTSLDALRAGRIPEVPLVEDLSVGALTPEFPYMGDGNTVTVSSDIVFDYTNGRTQFYIPTADGFDVVLPDINELPFGGPLLTVCNIALTGPKTLTFKNKATGATEFTLAVLKYARLYVGKDSGGARFWLAAGGT